MTETVIGVFDAQGAARAAVQDLRVARLPEAVIRCGTDTRRHPQVRVSVDNGYADVVTGILEQNGAVEVREVA